MAASSERFDDDENDDGRQQQDGHLVEPAVPAVRTLVDAFFELLQQRAAGMVIADRQHHQGQLGMQPASLEAVTEPQPHAQHQRHRHQDAAEAVQLARHQQQAGSGRGLRLHGQVDENDVKGFNPEHGGPRGSLVYARTSPWPNTTYFKEVKPSRPTGTRACSLSLEMPISAPRPYSKPSAKRVEALTMTEAESTSRRKRMASL